MPNAFLRIGTDERVTVIVNHSEMGQGVYTAVPMLLAEELDADWSKIGYESAPVNAKYNHPIFGMQLPEEVRERIFRVRTVSQRGSGRSGDADRSSRAAMECRSGESAYGIRNRIDRANRKLSYGQLAEAAAKMTPPAKVTLKDPKAFRLIGTPAKRLDTPEKINGKAVLGIDVEITRNAYRGGCPRSGLWRKGEKLR